MTQENATASPSTPGGSSLDELGTLAPDGSWVVTGKEPKTTSLTGWNRALRELDPESLSPRSKAIRLLITDEMQEGYSASEIGEKLGQPASWVAERLTELRAEIALNSGHFLPLTHTEFTALLESVHEHGVQAPIIIGDHQLIDGRHRWLVSEALGLKDIPAVFVQGLSAEQERQIAITVNTARRHLTRNQKRLLVRSELQRDWSRSSRLIAMICGVSQPTVEETRFEMRREAEEAKEIGIGVSDQKEPTFVPPSKDQDVRVDASGRMQKAYVEGRSVEKATEKMIGYGICPHGAYVHVVQIADQEALSIRESRD